MEQRLIAADLQKIAPLFEGWQETLIWSALEGGMGSIWTVCPNPKAALCENADFLFLAGSAKEEETRKLLEAWKQERKQFAILAPREPEAGALIEQVFGSNAQQNERYAFHKGGETFDVPKLERMAQTLPDGVEVCAIDNERYQQALQHSWSRDFVSQFQNAADFQQNGLGFLAVSNGELIGGASSYIRYSKGIELQVETRADWRRRGIASACCARLILECLKRKLYPSWDAANSVSAALAQKLGYRAAGTYPVWEIEAE